MKLETLMGRRVFGRNVQGIAAALLPYDARGAITVEEFQRHLLATHRASLMNAVNMDTGYVNYLSDAEQHEVLRWTRAALPHASPRSNRDSTFAGSRGQQSRCGPERQRPALRLRQHSSLLDH